LSISKLADTVVGVKRQTDPQIRLLQAAADPTRLAILRQLSSEGAVCACDFSCGDVAQPTVSHHLKVLREAGWIDGQRRGTWIWYTIRPDALAQFRAIAGELVSIGVPVPTPATSRRLPVIQPGA
jgi:DNA-binding transcriptional ArsR family regulator